MSDYPIILGVYSLRQETQIGLGDTSAKRDTLTYWFARQLDKDLFEIQPLNIYHVPSGVKTKLPAREFLKNYTPEPQYYKVFTVPALNSLAQKVASGEKFFAQGQMDESEKAFLKALMIDDLNANANYGLGKVYSATEDFTKLKKVLNTLLRLDEAFDQEHRQQFNNFGINLRKNKMYEEALNFYSRALEINAMDEHVYFNMARACYEKRSLDECLQHLNVALAINPDFTEARKFLEHCQAELAKSAD
jgi:tetratricopeptide (TPR) repeat protein